MKTITFIIALAILSACSSEDSNCQVNNAYIVEISAEQNELKALQADTDSQLLKDTYQIKIDQLAKELSDELAKCN